MVTFLLLDWWIVSESAVFPTWYPRLDPVSQWEIYFFAINRYFFSDFLYAFFPSFLWWILKRTDSDKQFGFRGASCFFLNQWLFLKWNSSFSLTLFLKSDKIFRPGIVSFGVSSTSLWNIMVRNQYMDVLKQINHNCSVRIIIFPNTIKVFDQKQNTHFTFASSIYSPAKCT